MGNEPSPIKNQTSIKVLSSPLVRDTPIKQEHSQLHQNHTATIKTVQRVTVDIVEQSSLPLTDQQNIIAEVHTKRAQQTAKKIVSLPALLPYPKRNRSMRLIEEIRSGKQNTTMEEAQLIVARPDPLRQVRQDAHIQVSDLRESEGGSGEVKQYRVKKMRVSKNSLHCPGAYF